ncbi:GDSL esterase/lipase At5g03610-like [Momordica charantia]|uniref:GDSL esterase/lipase At5g03610-like n=1 Tax=Momordica charantia TaxID=3673 RepID=A0A6J1BU66_MOMCH|nr:GDSL esterase/lipase At5g03610-like [Momordica charantia]
MESTKLFFLLSFFVSLMIGQGLGGHYPLRQHFEVSNKLLVFGDSYVDTGNEPSEQSFINYPYGMTFPGKPDGRYSDGYVLTDYFASFLGLESPIPYMQLYAVSRPELKDGVNFGVGGTGVFETLVSGPNITRQIDFLEELIDNSTLTPHYIDSSIALVSISGNDYMTYLVRNILDLVGFIKGIKPFVRSMVDETIENLKRINSLGVKKVVVTALGPVECVPFMTFLISYEQCFPVLSLVADYHNILLRQAVDRLNREATNDSHFSILDLHGAFSYIIQNKGYPEGNITFPTPLKPCCTGVCGQVDREGNKLYELCEDPKSAFYWDFVHPSHEGWLAAFSYLTDTDLKKSY